MIVERADFVSVPVTDVERSTGVCHLGQLTDPDGKVLMLHRRYAP